MTTASGFNEDFLDMLRALVEEGVEFVVVGAHAMAVHGVPRATGDLDLFVRATSENSEALLRALDDFGAAYTEHGVNAEDFVVPDTVYQLGRPPRRIDLMTSIDGVEFDEAWEGRVVVEIAGLEIGFLGREHLLRNKQATGREKDALDVRLLSR